MRTRGAVAAALASLAALGTPAVASAAFPGTNGRIAYWCPRESPEVEFKVCTIAPDGSNRIVLPIYGPNNNDGDLRWGPESERLAVGRGDAIVTSRADGADQHEFGGDEVGDQVWDRVGERLAFLDPMGFQATTLNTAGYDGSDRRTVTLPAPYTTIYSPIASSPVDDLLAFDASTCDVCQRDFLLTRFDGTLVRTLVDDFGGVSDWSPDGKSILLRHGSSTEWASLDVASGVATPLPALSGAGTATYSPDGTHVALVRPEGGTRMLGTVELATGTFTPLAPAGQPNTGTGHFVDWGNLPENPIPPTSFAWYMPERYNGDDRDGSGLADYFTPLNYTEFRPEPEDDGLNPGRWWVEVLANPCLPGFVYEWHVDGVPTTSGCAPHLMLAEDVDQVVTLYVNGVPASTQTIKPKDWLIVAIGDSYGSGEGNPDVAKVARPGPDVKSRWQDKQCHRSAFAAAPQTAELIEKAEGRSSVTLLHLSCSGATIPAGLVGSYKGAAPDADKKRPKPPQVSELQGLLGNAVPDALLISIGGNDVGFSSIITGCLVFRACHQGNKKCLPTKFRGLGKKVVKALTGKTKFCVKTPRALFAKKLGELRGHFARLSAALAGVPITDRSHVIVTGYPDITRGDDGRYCGTRGNSRILGDALPQVLDQLHAGKRLRRAVASLQRAGYLKIDGAEAGWAEDKVLDRLNETLQAIAEGYGWTYVGGHVDAAARHGYCADISWVQSWTEAKRLQEATAKGVAQSPGAVHPSPPGHINYRNALLPVLRNFGMPTG